MHLNDNYDQVSQANIKLNVVIKFQFERNCNVCCSSLIMASFDYK